MASNGTSDCAEETGGFCTLPGKCSSYTDLWQFSFKVTFPGTQDYIRIPLATFGADHSSARWGEVCIVMVQYVDDTNDIIVGSMFYQNFYARM